MNAQLAGPYDVRSDPSCHDEEPSRWPVGDWFTRRHGDYELILAREGVDDRQVESFLRADAEFGLAGDGPLVLLCFRFGELFPWAHVPFSSRHMPTGDRASSPPPADRPATERALLAAYLVEAKGIRTRACRTLTLSLEFTRALDELLRVQGRKLLAPGTQEKAIERLAKKGRPTLSLVEDAVCRTVGSP